MKARRFKQKMEDKMTKKHRKHKQITLQEIKNYKKQGLTIRQISKKHEITQTTIYNTLHKHNTNYKELTI